MKTARKRVQLLHLRATVPAVHCLSFIYARTHVKITLQWKSTLKQWLHL